MLSFVVKEKIDVTVHHTTDNVCTTTLTHERNATLFPSAGTGRLHAKRHAVCKGTPGGCAFAINSTNREHAKAHALWLTFLDGVDCILLWCDVKCVWMWVEWWAGCCVVRGGVVRIFGDADSACTHLAAQTKHTPHTAHQTYTYMSHHMSHHTHNAAHVTYTHNMHLHTTQTHHTPHTQHA